MWERTFSAPDREEFTPCSAVEGIPPDRIKFVVKRNTPRGEEYRFVIFWHLGCGDLRFVLAIYSKGPYRHVYAVCGAVLDPYEMEFGRRLARRLCRSLPANFTDDSRSSFWLEEAWEEAPDYPFLVISGD